MPIHGEEADPKYTIQIQIDFHILESKQNRTEQSKKYSSNLEKKHYNTRDRNFHNLILTIKESVN